MGDPRQQRRMLLTGGALAAVISAAVAAHFMAGTPDRQQMPTASDPAAIAGDAGRAVTAAVPKVPTGDPREWETLNPDATALRAAAISYATRFAQQWWAYDASAARPGRFVADDVFGRVGAFLDDRAFLQAQTMAIPAQVWAQVVADRQRSQPFAVQGHVPALWDEALHGPGADSIPAGTVMVTVTGQARISWTGGGYTNPDLAITVDVVCHPPVSAGARPACVIDYLFPRVAR